MSRVDELIYELCPEGVTLLMLGDVASVERGKTITKAETTPGAIPVLAGGRTPAYWHNTHNRSDEHVVVAGSGAYAGYVSFWDQPTWVSDAFTVIAFERVAHTKYLFYWLTSIQRHLHQMKRGGGVPHVYAKDVSKLSAPIPPLAVQEEIVRILDTFDVLVSSLSVGLPAEVAVRRKQYQYYREKLLTFQELAA